MTAFSSAVTLVYVDDGIFLGSNDSQLQEVIKEIQNLGLNSLSAMDGRDRPLLN